MELIEEKVFDKLPIGVQINLLINQCIIEQTLIELDKEEGKLK